ncbi:hypothetical protein [Maritalea sp.]|jgi:hypothetical protein|uniref:hypothetical protein n=1 Tax=Maritalea sp. TaxID=2003361 RepID=UPI0039E392D1
MDNSPRFPHVLAHIAVTLIFAIIIGGVGYWFVDNKTRQLNTTIGRFADSSAALGSALKTLQTELQASKVELANALGQQSKSTLVIEQRLGEMVKVLEVAEDNIANRFSRIDGQLVDLQIELSASPARISQADPNAVELAPKTKLFSLTNTSPELVDHGRYRTNETGPYCFTGPLLELKNLDSSKRRIDSSVVRMKAPFGSGFATAVAPWYDERRVNHNGWFFSGKQAQRAQFRFVIGAESAKKLVDPENPSTLKPEFLTPQELQVEVYYAVSGSQTESIVETLALPLAKEVIECITMAARGEYDDTFKYNYD